MRIQLKQNEIEAAIKGYLVLQGIAVQGKSVDMLFTSGRKNNGLSVEVVIVEPASIQTVEDTAETSAVVHAAAPEPTMVTDSEATPTQAGSLFG